ncbi:MAG: hypothetical protein NT136_00215 [Candidatus Moranbacteria bacterium]|nr:hypothetical protein [Candidatus Moranbacteria bacterium]
MDQKKTLSYEELVEGILTLPTEEAKRTLASVLKGLENLARSGKIKTVPIKEFRHAKTDAVNDITVIRSRHVAITHDINSYWFFAYPNRFENRSGWKHNESWKFTTADLEKEVKKIRRGAVVMNYTSSYDDRCGLQIAFSEEIRTKDEAETLLPAIAVVVERLQRD